MTTITIQAEVKGLEKTEFADIDEMLLYFMAKNTSDIEDAPLTEELIQEAEQVRQQFKANPEQFRRVVEA